MSSRKRHAAKGSAAQSAVAARGVPDSLESFLGGLSVPNPEDESSAHDGNMMSVNLKLLLKSSDTTKLKSLAELSKHVEAVAEKTLVPFVPNIVEVVIRHAQHTNELVRSGVFGLLRGVMQRSRTVKVALTSELSSLMVVWVTGMHDIVPKVRAEAREAFQSAFSPENRTTVVQKYATDISRGLLETITETIEHCRSKPLQDDHLDPRSNTLYASVTALGYMMRQASAVHSAVIAFVEQQALQHIMPVRAKEAGGDGGGSVKGQIAIKAPAVRSAALALLRDIVAVCPLTPKINQCVANALRGAVVDTNLMVVRRAWELLLLWCREGSADTIAYLAPNFLDDVIDSFMRPIDVTLAEVIFPSLLPLLTRLSRVSQDGRVTSMLDEFCGALVEKLKVLGDTPNVTSGELRLVLAALMECWELLCVRKRAESTEQHDDLELFTVSLCNLAILTESPARRARFAHDIAETVAPSFLRAARRCEPLFLDCLAVLCERPDAHFRALPDDARAELRHSFAILQSSVLAAAMARAEEKPKAALCAEATRLLEAHAQDGQWDAVAALLAGCNGAVPWKPSAESRARTVDSLSAAVIGAATATSPAQRSAADTAEAEKGHAAGAVDALAAALAWGDEALRPRLLRLADAAPWACELLRAHDMTDPARLFARLCEAVAKAEFDVVRDCLAMSASAGRVLQRGEVEALRAATRHVLEETVAVAAATGAESGGGARSKETDDEEEAEEQSEEQSEESGDATEDDEEEGGGSNEGAEVLYRLSGLADILCRGAPLANALTLSPSDASGECFATREIHADPLRLAEAEDTMEKKAKDRVSDDFKDDARVADDGADDRDDIGVFVSDLVPLLLRAVAAVSPPLRPEQYVSIRALRVVLQSAADPLLLAVERKRHWLGVNDFALLVEHVGRLLDSHEVSTARRDTVSQSLLDEIISDPSCSLAACGQLTRFVPFASDALLRNFATRTVLWDEHEMCPLRVDTDTGGDASTAMSSDTTGAILRRERSLETMRLTLLCCVRTAQCVRVLDASGAVDICDAAGVTCLLLRASRARAALAESIVSLLDTRLLPRALFRFVGATGAEAAVALSTRLENGLDTTLALALREQFARNGADPETMCGARAIASAVTARIVHALFSAEKISPAAVASHRAFFAFLDEAADAAGDSILSSLAPARDAAVREAACALPDLAPPAALLAITVHRHLVTRPVVAESTARLWVRHARSIRPLDGLELLAEAASARVLDAPAYGEIVHMVSQQLSQCYRLRHMPPNGRLVARAAKDTPPSLKLMCRIAVATVAARRGVVVHNRLDDALRSSVNLVIFDIVADCVVSLRQATQEEVPCIAQLLFFISGFLSDLGPADVAVLRASEASVATVASVLGYVYQWLCATSIARLEAIGMDIVAGAVRAVALLANLTLMHSTVDTQSTMRLITSKRSLKPMRSEFSSIVPAKRKHFTRHSLVISKTRKQKMALFPHLLAWCVSLTNTVSEPVTKERRNEVMELLDVLCALLLTQVVPGTRRVEDTYLCLGKSAEEQMGFEVIALTRISGISCGRSGEENSMEQLARGAAAVFALLLQSNTLSVVKSWLDTLEAGLRKLFFVFIEDHMSPLLIEESLLAVLSKSPTGEPTFTLSDRYTVSLSLIQRLVTLRYVMDDASVMVRITFPTAFPLRPPVVEYETGRDCGVSTEKWRSWMLKMTVLLFSGSANVWNCITLFGRNLDAHFMGQEPCPICFAIVSATSRQLPDMKCAVCSNSALHTECLYTWWANAGQTTCPLCRSPWVSS